MSHKAWAPLNAPSISSRNAPFKAATRPPALMQPGCPVFPVALGVFSVHHCWAQRPLSLNGSPWTQGRNGLCCQECIPRAAGREFLQAMCWKLPHRVPLCILPGWVVMDLSADALCLLARAARGWSYHFWLMLRCRAKSRMRMLAGQMVLVAI